MNRLRILCALAVPVLVTPIALLAQVVETSTGVIEFLGLEKWTPKMIQGRLGYTSADQLHYCAADLNKIGFPDAAVFGYSDHGRRYTVITVVEPQRAADVVYGPRPARHISIPEPWQALRKAVQDPKFLEGGVLDYARTLPGARTDQPPLADGTAQDWWPALHVQNGEADYKQAREVLSAADDPGERAVAAVVLMNFADHDGAWHSLVKGLRDPESLVNATCLQGLNSLATYLPRKVGWASVQSDMVRILRGTNLFAFPFLLKVLTVTKIEPTLARPLLGHGGGRIVLAYLRAVHQDEHNIAHGFLVQLHGSDLGNESSPWETWVASL